MKRREKEAIIDRLLLITGISIGASLVIWFIYRGYMNTAYILAMPKVVMSIFGASIIIIALLSFQLFKGNYKLGISILKNRKFKLILWFISVAIGSLFIYYYVLYAIYALWLFIGIYLLYNYIAEIYKIATK